ncbi:MAG: OmpH family outer membrane protein [Mucilaginibacter sp.]
MKTRASFLTTLSIGLLAAGSIVGCNQNKTGDKATTPASATAAGGSIVYVNQDTISLKYEYAKDMRKRLEDKGNTVKGDVGSRQQSIQREYAEYQKDQNTMSADQRSSTEQRLTREGQEFQQYQQNASAEFQNDQADESKKLYDKVFSFSKQYAKDNGYKMILTFQSGNVNLLYADPSMDVTVDFLKKLNDGYAKEKK